MVRNGVGVDLVEDTIVRESNLELVYLTNEYGEQSIKWVKNNEPKDKNTLLNILSNSQYLVPVLLNKNDYPEILEENKIFWFKPSEALFDSLPKTISRQLKSEYNYITAETIEEKKKFTTSCTYFEECKSTLKVEQLKMFPNPAKQIVQVDFSLPESINGNIILVSISGSELKELVPSTTFMKGYNSFQFDISEIVSGIYLVMIKTSKGFKTQRLIISQ